MTTIEGVRAPASRTAQKSFEKIVESAQKLFYEKGYSRTTINDIMCEAGLGIGTFYIYFDGKHNAYLYILKKYEREIKNYIARRIENLSTRREKEREGIRAFILYCYQNPACYNVIWESLYIDPELFKDYYSRFAQSYMRNLAAAGEEMLNVDLSTAAYVLMGISNFIGLKAIFEKDLTEEKLDMMVETIDTILTKGMFKE